MSVQNGAALTLDRADIADARAGLLAMGAGTRIAATDIIVRDMLGAPCTDTGCPPEPEGLGVGSFAGATVEVERFVVERASLCGIQVASAGILRLRTGEVRENEIGACVQIEGYDIGTLSSDVGYRDNGTNLQTTTLPVPEPLEGLPDP